MATITTGMYSIRPVFILPPAECPHSSSMYKVRSIHGDGRDDRRRRHDAAAAATATTTADFAEVKMPDDPVVTQAPLPEYGALEARQEKILSQLAELKKQVSTLCQYLKQPNLGEATKDVPAIQKPAVIKLVLNANPRKPPYSIFALQRLWKDTDISVTSYIHSNTTFKPLVTFPKIITSATNVVELILIWKEVSEMEIITDTFSCPIRGEVNFLRYLSRSLESYNYERTCLQPHTLDYALDCVYMLHHERDIQTGLLELATQFENWSCKGGFNIVDIAVWSLIKQFPKTHLPKNLVEWYAQCENVFMDL